MHSICWSWLIYSYFSLDIIGKVALGHDFKSGQTAEAQEIAASWHGVVTMAQTFGAFVAQLVLRAFPFITSLPIPALQTPGVVKVTCGKLSRRLLDRGVVEGEKSNDILSILVRANKKESGRGLTEEQIIDNVRMSRVPVQQPPLSWFSFPNFRSRRSRKFPWLRTIFLISYTSY